MLGVLLAASWFLPRVRNTKQTLPRPPRLPHGAAAAADQWTGQKCGILTGPDSSLCYEAQAACKARAGKAWRRNLWCGPSCSWGPPHTRACSSTFHGLGRDKLLFHKASLDSWCIPAQTLLFQSRKEQHPASSSEEGSTELHRVPQLQKTPHQLLPPEGQDTWPSCQNFHQATNHNIIKTVLLAQMNNSRLNEEDC